MSNKQLFYQLPSNFSEKIFSISLKKIQLNYIQYFVTWERNKERIFTKKINFHLSIFGLFDM